MLSLYRAVLALRRAESALSIGAYVPVRATEAVLVYERRHANRRLLVALNMSAQPQDVPEVSGMLVLLSTYLDRTGRDGTARLRLRPGEGVITEVEDKRQS